MMTSANTTKRNFMLFQNSIKCIFFFISFIGMAQIVEMAIRLQEDAAKDAASDEGTSRKRRLSSFATFTASTITSLNEKGPK